MDNFTDINYHKCKTCINCKHIVSKSPISKRSRDVWVCAKKEISWEGVCSYLYNHGLKTKPNF